MYTHIFMYLIPFFNECYIECNKCIRYILMSEKFKTGEIVYHIKHGYRAVVVYADPYCEADDEWYFANESQPEKNQPWYHVLVDGDDHATYIAESSLEYDMNPYPIQNPLVHRVFPTFYKGRYYTQNLN